DPDPHLLQSQLKVVERLTRRLGRLVDDLLFLARQDGGMAQRTDSIALDELIEEVLEEQGAIASEKAIALSFQTDDEGTLGYKTQGDRDQFTRLFTNLVSNAVQYTPSGGKVQIMLQHSKHHGLNQLQIQIKDTGIGIPEESLPHLFDRFYRVDPARTHAKPLAVYPVEKTTGSGLGLAIAKVIVENHQGQIQVESQPNQGTTFTVMFPATS
ncbi:MAG: sensor histidine kinase, partial [Leptolyngbyaceae cyanobacterium SL_5_9]|nr:sensor histidine kinase [Leptolyngbyaceae cyanobacterium SL_5_9]